MGSPISGLIAEWKVRLMEEIIKTKFKDDIIFWVRYVDDVFAIIKEETDEDVLLKNINKIDKNIQFTIEKEKNNQINYLDVSLKKTDNGNLETTVYRKPNSSNVIINAKCKTPYNFKLASLRSYINRAILVCSNDNLLKKELKEIENTAVLNGYSKEIVKNLYKKRIKAIHRIEPGQKQKKNYTAPAPYLRKATTKLKNEAQKINYNVPIKPYLNIFQRIKSDRDQLDPKETAGVYKIDYETGGGLHKRYIGVTKRKIKDRIKEHESDVKHRRLTTALAREAAENNIEIDFKNAKKK